MARALAFGAVLVLALAALNPAHAADTSAAAADAQAPSKAPAVAAAAKVAEGYGGGGGRGGGGGGKGGSRDNKEPKDRYAKYEEGTGSDKGVKQMWKYLNPALDVDCSPFLGNDCPGDPCSDPLLQLNCAPGSVCTPVCNGCGVTCAVPLTCTGGECRAL